MSTLPRQRPIRAALFGLVWIAACESVTAPPATAGVFTFSSTTPIAIPAMGTATPYPSTIAVSGVPASDVAYRVTVTLRDLNHPRADFLDVLLVGPLGHSVLLLGRTGAPFTGIAGRAFTLSDCAAASVPSIEFPAAIVTRATVYRPTSAGTTAHALPPPAPAGGPSGNQLAVFSGLSGASGLNGTWSLYAVGGGNAGTIASGWQLTILTDITPRPPACATHADFDGDGRADLGVYRTTTAEWLIPRSGGAGFQFIQVAFGSPFFGDRPVFGDYDGDGVTDLAVYRATTGEWFVLRSLDRTVTSLAFGSPAFGDIPVPGDYDGDGITDFAIYRPGGPAADTGFYILPSSPSSNPFGSVVHLLWGSSAAGDIPLGGR